MKSTLKQRILAIILCIAMITTSVSLTNFFNKNLKADETTVCTYTASGLTWQFNYNSTYNRAENLILKNGSAASITIPNTVTANGKSVAVYSIGDGFSNSLAPSATVLTTLNIPAGIKQINANAFYNCSKMTTLTLGADINFVDTDAFYGCPVKTLNYNITNLSGDNGKGLIGMANARGNTVPLITFGTNVQTLPNGLFKNVSNITYRNNTSTTIYSNNLWYKDELLGHYAFNTCGAAIAPYDAVYTYDATNSAANWYKATSHVDTMKDLEFFTSSYRGANSSGSKLESNDITLNGVTYKSSIYKAYLVVEQRQAGTNDHYNFPFLLAYAGNSEKASESKSVFIANRADTFGTMGANWQWSTSYVDVTDFVKENGYGWYYYANNPYNAESYRGDQWTSWKLIVIEENQGLPVRYLNMQLGSKQSGSAQWTTLQNTFKNGLKGLSTGEVTGQLMYSLSGADSTRNVACNTSGQVGDIVMPEDGHVNYVQLYNGTSWVYLDMYAKRGIRSLKSPVESLVSKNGIPVQSEVKYTAGTKVAYWKNNNTSMAAQKSFYSTGQTITNAVIPSGYHMDYGGDIEIADINNAQNNVNMSYINNQTTVGIQAYASGCVLQLTGLGISIDIDAPDFEGDITSTFNTENTVISTGYVKNTSTNNVGIIQGTSTVEVDKNLNIEEVSAVYTKANGTKVNLSTSNGTIIIDKTNNTVKFVMGTSTNTVDWENSANDLLEFSIRSSIKNGANKYDINLNTSGIPTSAESAGMFIDKIIEKESSVAADCINATVNWSDYSDYYKYRPNSFKISLYKNGNLFEEKVLSTTDTIQTVDFGAHPVGDSWEIKYDVLPIYYSTVQNDKSTIAGNGKNYSYELINTLKTASVRGTATWIDNNNANGSRPSNTTITLTQKCNGKVTNTYTYNMPDSAYNVWTDNVWDYDMTSLIGYPPLYYDKDGNEYEYELSSTQPVSKNVNFEYAVTYNGFNITYTETEAKQEVTYVDVIDSINGKVLKTYPTEIKEFGTVVDGKDKGGLTTDNAYYKGYYLAETTSATVQTSSLTIYRIFKLRTIDIKGDVTWIDASNKHNTRPENVSVYLYKNGTQIDEAIGLASNNKNAFSFLALPKYDTTTGEPFVYTVSQSKVESLTNPEDTYTTKQSGYNITNTLGNFNVIPDLPPVDPQPVQESYEIHGTVKWVDYEDKLGYRPSSITLILYKDGVKYTSGEYAINSNKHEYEFSFTNLPKYDENLNKYVYTIEEVVNSKAFTWDKTIQNYKEIDAYTITSSGYNFVNTLVEPIDIGVKPDHINTLTLKLDFNKNIDWNYLETNASKVQSLVTLKRFHSSMENGQIVYSEYFDNTKYNVIVTKNGVVLGNIPSGKYEITTSNNMFNLENINLSNSTNMTLENKNGKYYLIIDETNTNNSGLITITLDSENHIGYETMLHKNNHYNSK